MSRFISKYLNPSSAAAFMNLRFYICIHFCQTRLMFQKFLIRIHTEIIGNFCSRKSVCAEDGALMAS
jgi:hypothetical protein